MGFLVNSEKEVGEVLSNGSTRAQKWGRKRPDYVTMDWPWFPKVMLLPPHCRLPCNLWLLQKPLSGALHHSESRHSVLHMHNEAAPLMMELLHGVSHDHFLSSSVLKAFGSASAIAFSVTMYHRSLRSFLPDKKMQRVNSSVVYFFWNLFLISSRLTALALFASVLPCFILAHFLCSWLVLFFFAWRSQTDFMDSPGGEWLYRATVGLIWYFDWFSVVEGRTRYRTLLYHGYILADISLLCSLWCWKMSTEPPYFEISPLYAIITAVSVVAVYILGLLFKVMYYQCFHPNLSKEELKGDTGEESQTGQPPITGVDSKDETDKDVLDSSLWLTVSECTDTDVVDRSWRSPPAPDIKRCNKRMRKLAENFYSWPASLDIHHAWRLDRDWVMHPLSGPAWRSWGRVG